MKYRTPSYADGVFDGYIFEKNLQGDIVAIYDLNTNKIVEYKYDAWGNFTVEGTSANTIGTLNPFRYRGYYFDTEINLYYLQSRYYNSVWARFINPDHAEVITATPAGLTDKNLFAYCDNNPITRVDGDGAFWNIVIGAIVGAAMGALTTWINGGSTSEILVSAACGAISGGLSATGLGGVVGQVVIGALTSAIDSGYQNYNDYKEGTSPKSPSL